MGLFSRKPSIEPTGDADDDQLLRLLARAPGGLDVERHWIHYLYCADDDGAAELQAKAEAAGWTVKRVVPEYHGIVAERHDLVINPDSTRSTREFFDALAASVDGGMYDGWEASAG